MLVTEVYQLRSGADFVIKVGNRKKQEIQISEGKEERGNEKLETRTVFEG